MTVTRRVLASSPLAPLLARLWASPSAPGSVPLYPPHCAVARLECDHGSTPLNTTPGTGGRPHSSELGIGTCSGLGEQADLGQTCAQKEVTTGILAVAGVRGPLRCRRNESPPWLSLSSPRK